MLFYTDIVYYCTTEARSLLQPLLPNSDYSTIMCAHCTREGPHRRCSHGCSLVLLMHVVVGGSVESDTTPVLVVEVAAVAAVMCRWYWDITRA